MFNHVYNYNVAQVLAYRALDLCYVEISKATGLPIVTVKEIVQRLRSAS